MGNMKCMVPDCNTNDTVYMEITCYRRIGETDQFVKTSDKEMICSHHHLMHNFASILALKKYNLDAYNELRQQTERILNSMPEDVATKLVTVRKVKKR